MEGLKQNRFSQFIWSTIIYELVEFKNVINIELLLQWLNNIIDDLNSSNISLVYNIENPTLPSISPDFTLIDHKLYKKNPDKSDYFNITTGIPKLLGEIGDIRAVPILIAALQNEKLYNFNWNSRICVAKALGQLKDQRATTPLIETLNDPSDRVRKTVVWSLGEIGDIRSARALITALQDEDKEVRNAAREAFMRLISLYPSIEDLLDF